MSASELAGLVETWHRAATDVVALLRSLDEADWRRTTDLPGWDVRAVACHLAHLESELAGNPQRHVEVPELPHVRGLMGQFTEAGVLARADLSPAEIVDELEASVATRYAALQSDPPQDAGAPGPGFAALVGWSWRTLLSNRPLDLWMHEQDIRRAVGRPGGLDSPAAAHTVGVLAAALPYVLGKRVGAQPGQSAALVVTGAQPLRVAAEIGEDGRGAPRADTETTTTRLTLDAEDFLVRAGGRRGPDEVAAVIEGDEDLGRRVLAGLATTP